MQLILQFYHKLIHSFDSLIILILLTLVFVIWQIYQFLLYILNLRIINFLTYVVFNTPFLSQKIMIVALIDFLARHLIVYGLYLLFIRHIILATQRVCSLGNTATLYLSLLTWASSIFLILFANTIFLPHSIFAWSLSYTTPLYFIITGVILAACLIYLLCCIAISDLFICYTKRCLNFSHYLLFGILLIELGMRYIDPARFFYGPLTPSQRISNLPSAIRPNIIMIGIDGLRPDYIQHYDTQHHILMPHLAHLLNNSLYFTNAYTPVSQTFPAWISLLTGKYPRHHGARGFYTDYNDIDLRHTLPKLLHQAGYKTAYATDQQAYAEMTSDVGFDHIISPAFGAAEWIYIVASDFPLINLALFTRVGKWLFPYNYANRSASVTYHPEDFLTLIAEKIKYFKDKPLFLALHFNLTHWPFTWANDGLKSSAKLSQKYSTGLQAIDQQLNQYFKILKKNHFLEHAIIVLFSDHGISLGLPGDRMIDEQHYLGSPNLDKIRHILGVFSYDIPIHQTSAITPPKAGINTSYFYGDILSIRQNQVLLAFKSYGVPLEPPHRISTRASLLDITPTLLHLLQLPPFPRMDGQIRLHATSQESTQFHHLSMPAALFIETGFKAADISTANIPIAKILQSVLYLVGINPHNGLLFIQPSLKAHLIKNKQRAILLEPWLLAYYPSKWTYRLKPSQLKSASHKNQLMKLVKSHETEDLIVLVNLQTKYWTTNLHSKWAQKAPVQILLNRFKDFYGNEIKPIPF